ncbi:hypothetical protein C8A05DRAFT_39371 [Staphylotrichum tortipilum]|uniref:Iron-sulfur cluster assembly factor IBA57 homolog, mitochondrial n=1 Tax=Staphylotrichum tortipilum TaxID=2831512 RepID=A0AAN6RNY6_9PEZI|nr:hypothetical protein C8A05DRAFT_39371 [Staphylotrichum longicolle]
MQPATRRCLARRLTAPRHQRRGLSVSAARPAATPLPPAAPSPSGFARLSERKLLSVSGPDAAKFLQGVITANLFPQGGDAAAAGGRGAQTQQQPPPLRSDLGFYAAFLAAQGRVLHDMFVYRDVRDAEAPPGHAWLLEVDAEQADRVRAYIARYKLRAKVAVRVLDDGEVDIWHAWGGGADMPASSSDAKSHLLIRDPRAPPLGHRLLTFPSSALASIPPSNLPFPLPPLTAEVSYRLHRYLTGVPEGQLELLRDVALPHESNMDAQARSDGLGALDFRKGCYTGQELTIRTQHRGVVRKRVLPCLLYPYGSSPAAGDKQKKTGDETQLAGLYRPEIGADVEGDAARVLGGGEIERLGRPGKAAGKWLRGVGNVGLAVCRLESMTDVALPGEARGRMGFTGEEEFAVGMVTEGGAVGGKVKVRAFVPGWLRGFLKGQGEGQGH